MYKAFYKCRLCRKKYSINITEEESNSFDNASFKNSDCAIIPDHTILHRCGKNKIGAADLVGFKKER
jgi:hypothetical protein